MSSKWTITLGWRKIIPVDIPTTAVETDDITTYYYKTYSLTVELSGTH